MKFTCQVLKFAVIPDFLAKKISTHVCKTGGQIEEQQFSQLVDVIHEYQEVSILFADIKGFTGKSYLFRHSKLTHLTI